MTPTNDIQYWTDFGRNPFMWITGDPEIGERTWIGPFVVIDGAGDLSIGDDCSIAGGAHIYTHEMRSSGREGVIERSPTSVGDRVYIGANAVVQMGCTIADDATIAAGAVVTKGTHVDAGDTWAGVPARRIRDDADQHRPPERMG